MEGPAFSTRAESKLHQSWGADVIGMTALPEAKLAREAEICYAVIACSTDYDSWHEYLDPVSVEMVMGTLHHNIELSKKIIRLAVGRMPAVRDCVCASAMRGAVITDPALIPQQQKEKLDLIIGKYI
jgi:5'-methylthioadenosine phosphorylase